nr:hypothetical protein [Tanacetum cinerariifolium]
TSSRSISSNSNTDGLVALVSKLDNLGHDMKKLKENVHTIQVGWQICKGPHLDKECPLNEKVKQLEEVNYGASVKVMPRNMFEYLRLANLKNTNMLVEMADMTKKAPLDMPFLAPIHVEINVFDKEISLGTDNDRVSYDMKKNDHNVTIPTENFFMIKSDLDNTPQSPACSNNESRNLRDRSPDDSLLDQSCKNMKIELDQHIPRAHFCKPIKQAINEQTQIWPTCDPPKDPLFRSFLDYTYVFDLEVDQLADEYELRIRKKGHILDKIWEYCKDVHRDNNDHGFTKKEREE